MRFSVLTYDIDGYETIHPIPQDAINGEIEYVYVTNKDVENPMNWNVVKVDNLTGDTFEKCYQIRFNPFDYVSNDIVVQIDGSMAINKDFSPIVERFVEGGYNIGVSPHPLRNTIDEEYKAWELLRKRKPEQSRKCLDYLESIGYDTKNYRGLYQGGFRIVRNDVWTNEYNRLIFDTLKRLATPPATIERVNQTISSALLNLYYSDKKVMPISPKVFWHSYTTLCEHKTETPQNLNYLLDVKDYWLFNEKTECIE